MDLQRMMQLADEIGTKLEEQTESPAERAGVLGAALAYEICRIQPTERRKFIEAHLGALQFTLEEVGERLAN